MAAGESSEGRKCRVSCASKEATAFPIRPSHTLRVALDLSPLTGHFPLSIVRLVEPIVSELRQHPGVELVECQPRRGRRPALWRQTTLPREAKRAGAELIHCFSSSFPVASTLPVVQTVHELPWKHGVVENAGLRHRAWVRAGARLAAATATPSAFVAHDLGHSERVHVISWGVSDDFCLNTEAMLDPREPYVLAPGATRPKKNLEQIARGAAQHGCRVLVTGERTRYVDDCVEAHANIDAVGRVDAAALPVYFRHALATAIVATSEGFALPVLESLRCGTPVVTSRGSAQSMTAGQWAIDVDAADPRSIAEGIEAASARDEATRKSAAAWAAEFTWKRTADELVALWQRLLA